MIFIEWPAVIVALLPVILIEAAVHRRQFGTAYKKALYPVGLANLASTFLGYPLAWILRLIAQFILSALFALVMQLAGDSSGASMTSLPSRLAIVLVDSAWLPGDAEGALGMVPLAALIGLAPSFFVSVYAEAWVLGRIMKGEERSKIVASSYRANLASYACLAAFAAVMIVRLALRH